MSSPIRDVFKKAMDDLIHGLFCFPSPRRGAEAVGPLTTSEAKDCRKSGIEKSIQQIRDQSEKPIAFGFGISDPKQVQEISRFADGIIVGSAIVKTIEENLGRSDLIAKVGNFISSLTNALK